MWGEWDVTAISHTGTFSGGTSVASGFLPDGTSRCVVSVGSSTMSILIRVAFPAGGHTGRRRSSYHLSSLINRSIRSWFA
jgi:hypothetical protein